MYIYFKEFYYCGRCEPMAKQSRAKSVTEY